MAGSSANAKNILALLKSNEEQRTIAKTTKVEVCKNSGYQGLYIVFTVPELRQIEQLLHIQVDTDPERWIMHAGLPQDKTYNYGGLGNVVGVSLYLAVGATVTDPTLGSTLTFTAVVLGF